MIGLALTRWESDSQSLHFTPNRSLVLLVTLLVAARIVYGFWRAGIPGMTAFASGARHSASPVPWGSARWSSAITPRIGSASAGGSFATGKAGGGNRLDQGELRKPITNWPGWGCERGRPSGSCR